jgi:hypothetical protein
MKKVVEHFQSNRSAGWSAGRLVCRSVGQRLLWRWFHHLKIELNNFPKNNQAAGL